MARVMRTLSHLEWTAPGTDPGFRMLFDEAQGELGYLLADPLSGEAVLIDARSRDLPLLAALLADGGLRLRWVLRTHSHDAPAGQPDEVARLASLGAPVIQGRAQPDARCPEPGERLRFGQESLQVLRTPGHTPHCLSFVWRDRVFCGGLMATDCCRRQPWPADPEAMWDSVNQQIFTLPDEVLLFGAHAGVARAVATVLEARLWHPWFSGQTRDGFLAHVARLRSASDEAHSATSTDVFLSQIP